MSGLLNISSITSKIGSGSTPRGGERSYLSDGVPFIRSQNVQFGHLEMSNVAFIGEDVHQRMIGTHVRPNDVLLNITGASIGRCAVVPDTVSEANVNQHVCIIRINKDKYHPKFLSEFLNSKKGQYLIDAAQSGGSRQGLNFQEVGGLKIPDVEYNTQQKIVEILSNCDTAIDTCSLKLKKLQDYQSKLVTYIFSKSRGYVESWQGVSEICDVSIGGTPARKNPDYWAANEHEGFAWVSISDLNQKEVFHTKEYITQAGVNNSNVKLIPAGTTLMSFKLTLGRLGIAGRDIYTNEAIAAFIPKRGDISNNHIRYSLSVMDWTVDTDQAVKGKTLNKAKILDSQIPILRADVADKVVEAIEEAEMAVNICKNGLSHLKKQKRGLMQQLLTGKLRVKGAA